MGLLQIALGPAFALARMLPRRIRSLSPTSQIATDIYSFDARRIDGRVESMSVYRGQVLLIVNVASRCGFTSQYSGLQSLYEEFHRQGFSVLGFPCDQFGGQEPGEEADIQKFCTTQFQVTFPMFGKVNVNGSGAHPLFQYLSERCRGLFGFQAIGWNFTKFLIDRNGRPRQRIAPTTNPLKLKRTILQLLDEPLHSTQS